MRNKVLIIFILFLFSVSFQAKSQKQVNSPYSRFNIGTMEPAGSFKSLGMGGVSTAMRDNLNVFFSNPAAYSAFDTTSFLFDFGIDYSSNKLASGGRSYTSDDMNFDHLMMGFPLAKGLGLALGVTPFSNGYFKLRDEVVSTDPDYNPLIGSFTSSHTGDGGLTSVFAGSGIRLHKYVSAGVNMTLLFGQLTRINKFVFDDTENSYNDNSTEKLQLSGINLNYGVQFTFPLKERRFINAGISYTSAKNYNSDYENFIFRYNAFGTADTIDYTSLPSGSVRFPGSLKTGIAFGKTDKLTVGFDFTSTNWSDARIPGSEGYAADTKTYNFGIEYTPEKYSNLSYFRRIDYRLGARMGDNYLVINGEQLKEIGVTAGLGIPMRRGTLSKANIFIDYSRRYGSVSNGLHMEHYITAGASINLYDFWFLKPKYN